MRIELHHDDGRVIDVTEAVQIVYDMRHADTAAHACACPLCVIRSPLSRGMPAAQAKPAEPPSGGLRAVQGVTWTTTPPPTRAARTGHTASGAGNAGANRTSGAMRDPRSHRRYVNARRAWLAGYSGPAPCALCGRLVDVRLPGTHRYGPTVEHRYPIRAILAQARSEAEALAFACDTSLWSLAHRICQDRQGQRVTSERRKKRRQKPESPQSSRQW